jgi:hypothetical protein
MKKLLLLTTLLLTFACSKDDESSNTEQNFLEKYDDYAFENDDGNIFFINNGEYFLTVFVNEGDGSTCVSIKEGNYTDDDIFGDVGEVKIVTNDSNSFAWEFVYQYDGETYRDNYEYTVNTTGNIMTITYDGDSDDTETLVKISAKISDYCN